ncbi:hypothetical protein FQA39_LY12056 [Lamprigera yunnana]|nr:hypothetical protein FQA39_LY12056 [Lamprigera yunnana]
MKDRSVYEINAATDTTIISIMSALKKKKQQRRNLCVEERRYNIDTAREILQKMIDDEPFDNEGEADSRDDKDLIPSADDIEDEDNVEIEELEADLLLEADSDECDDDTNHVGQYFTAKKWDKVV